MPKGQDPLLLLLKGHLLIEEELFAYIASYCKDVKKLSDARLTASQKLHVAHALGGGLFDGRMSECLKKLNSIRNHLSHRAELPNLKDAIDDYLKAWDDDNDYLPPKRNRQRTGYLRNTLIFQIAMLSGYNASRCLEP